MGVLDQWRHRPPNRYDFILDLESFAFFNYQYILYGMEFATDLPSEATDLAAMRAAEKLLLKIRRYGERAADDLPSHRQLIDRINGQPAS